jgi:hypothetical protein
MFPVSPEQKRKWDEERLDELIMKSMAEGLSGDEAEELADLVDQAKESGINIKKKVFELGGSLRDYNRLMKRLSRIERERPTNPLDAAGKKVLEEESKYLREKIEKDFETIRKVENVLAKYSKDLKAEGRPFEEVIDSALDFYFNNRDEVEALREKINDYRALVGALIEFASPKFNEVLVSRLYCDLIVQLVTLKARGLDITPEDIAEAVKAVRGGIGMVYADNQLLKGLLRMTNEELRRVKADNEFLKALIRITNEELKRVKGELERANEELKIDYKSTFPPKSK